MSSDPVVVAGYARTPMGSFQGELSDQTAHMLGAKATAAALERAKLEPEDVEQVILGCVLTAGQGQAPARQAMICAGIPDSAGAITVNKMCGSGMQAAMIASDMLVAGSVDLVVAGGMESMTNAPYIVGRARTGLRMGHHSLIDHMFLDGLEDAYERGRLMGTFAEDCAEDYQFTRADQDAFAIASLAKAQQATKDGLFEDEIAPIVLNDKRGTRTVSQDEQPFKASLEKIPTLKPAFREDGTVTAANASSISDGAASLVLTRASVADKRGLVPVARVVGHATFSQAPRLFATAPIGAINRLLDRIGWRTADVDLFEINEAFAVVPMAAIRDLKLPPEKVNVRGGACALGHPIGASGARVLVTLISALRQRSLKRGIASLCIGGGEATAMAVEIIG